jgi:N-methylhydantoinase A
MRQLVDLDSEWLRNLSESLAERALGKGDGRGKSESDRWATLYTLRARYRGQGHELEIPFDGADTHETLAGRFAATHRARYGFTLDGAIEVVSARCTRSGEAPEAKLGRRGRCTWSEAERFDDGSECSAVVTGRAVIALTDATLLVSDGWRAQALPIGGWLLERA